MSACSMLSENTGHGVRTTHRTNALIRPGSAAGVATNPPYRSAATCRKLQVASASPPMSRNAERSRDCRDKEADRYLSAVSLLLPMMSGVFTRLVGQEAVEAELLAAAKAARGDSAHSAAGDGTMTHAWLITGPPGSGRSVAALCFAAALQCTSDRGARLRALPGLHDDDGRHPRRRAPGHSRRPVHRRRRDARDRADRVAPSEPPDAGRSC